MMIVMRFRRHLNLCLGSAGPARPATKVLWFAGATSFRPF
jgi:hypothetical protein